MSFARYPTREDIIQLAVDEVFGTPILNNAHRGDVVEMIVYAALRPEWKFVGLGWHPWDLQRGHGADRVRIQVKQCAALQLWGKTQRPTISFGWKKQPPSYFERDNPGEPIEAEGWFCEVFVIGVHEGVDEKTTDQVDPRQWRFLVIPTCDLARGTNSMVLTRALAEWRLLDWSELRDEVEAAVLRQRGAS